MPPIRVGNVFVAEQTDKQDRRYEDEDVHMYSPKNLFDTSCQAIKSPSAPSASPNTFDESAPAEECTLLLLIVCLTVGSDVKPRHAPIQSFMMLLRYGIMISSMRSCISNTAPLRHQSKATPFMIVTKTSA